MGADEQNSTSRECSVLKFKVASDISWARRLFKVVLWLAVFILVLGATMEGYLRHLHYKPNNSLCCQPLTREECSKPLYYVGERQLDPELGWTNPIGSIPMKEGCYGTATVLPNGRRASYEPNRVSGNFRIALLGCSFTYGTGVSDRDTFAWQLNDLYPQMTFENYGVEGYGTAQCWATMKRIFESQNASDSSKFDVYVYSGIFDHYFRNISYHTFELSDGRMYIYPPARRDNCYLSKLYESYWWGEECSVAIYWLHRRWLSGLMDYNGFYREKVPFEWQKDTFAIVPEIIGEMDKLAKDNGAKFVCMALDAPFYERVSKALDDSGIELINAILMAQDKPECFNSQNGRFMHPNGQGHAFFAEKLSNWLEANSISTK